jgi:hypothetical protein
MRLELHVEQLQARFGEPSFELFPLAAAPVVLQAVGPCHDGRIDDEL